MYAVSNKVQEPLFFASVSWCSHWVVKI